MKIRICKTMVEPREISMASSKNDGTFYKVTSATIFNDTVCECPGYIYRGICKHITAVDMMRHSFIAENNETICPTCNVEIIEYDF